MPKPMTDRQVLADKIQIHKERIADLRDKLVVEDTLTSEADEALRDAIESLGRAVDYLEEDDPNAEG